MNIKRTALALPLALPLALAACDDSERYETEISGLQSELETVRTDLETRQAEYDALVTEAEELRAAAEANAEAAGAEVSDAVVTQLNDARMMVTRTTERLAAIEREPDAGPDMITEAVTVLQEDMQALNDSIESVAGELGVELAVVETEPAPVDQQQPAAATTEQQPADAGTTEQPAQQQPAQQQ